MELHVNDLDKSITLIKLVGKLDIVGVNQIETKFAAHCAGEKPRVIVDLSEVDFLASIGIHLLVTNAKSLRSRNGKMVLLNPTPDVMRVLDIADIPSIIPVYSQLESAEAVLLGH